jgi:hypothetical protein
MTAENWYEDSSKPVEISQGRNMPHMSGRIADQEDVKAGRAVFFIQNPTANKVAHFDIILPRGAVRLQDGTPLIVIQSEKAGQAHWLGCRHVRGGKMIYEISEVQFLEGPDKRFY